MTFLLSGKLLSIGISMQGVGIWRSVTKNKNTAIRQRKCMINHTGIKGSRKQARGFENILWEGAGMYVASGVIYPVWLCLIVWCSVVLRGDGDTIEIPSFVVSCEMGSCVFGLWITGMGLYSYIFLAAKVVETMNDDLLHYTAVLLTLHFALLAPRRPLNAEVATTSARLRRQLHQCM